MQSISTKDWITRSESGPEKREPRPHRGSELYTALMIKSGHSSCMRIRKHKDDYIPPILLAFEFPVNTLASCFSVSLSEQARVSITVKCEETTTRAYLGTWKQSRQG